MSKQQQPVGITSMLYRQAPLLLGFAVVAGAAAGALYSLIIPFVLGELGRQGGGQPPQGPLAGVVARFGGQLPVLLYFGVCVLILLSKASSVILVNNIAKSATAELRMRVARKINRMMIDQVENTGFPRLLNILVDDVNNVAAAAVAVPMLLVSAVTVVGMLGYLATLNLAIFAIVLAAVVGGVALFQFPVALATGLYTRARALRDVIQEGLRGLVMGVYELKLDRAKSARYIEEELVAPQFASARLEKIGDAMIHLAGTASDLLSFLVIGLVVFVLPRHMALPAAESVGVVMALLYIAAPVASILGMLQHLRVGQVALGRIHGLEAAAEEPAAAPGGAPIGRWQSFSARAVSYRYAARDGDAEGGFALAPVSLSFQRGQINFIVGGNGSGKSTLSKLLSLHYRPAAGAICFDGVPVDGHNLEQARARIGVIYSNYYLFGKLHRACSDDDRAMIEAWLGLLGLAGKTRFVDGAFTTTRLSDGQRRRLALLVALLEDKDIYVFDEWAADQDPGFKQVFYHDILQELKRKGKLVIVITHDDRYFACADRVIFMEDGRMVGVKEQAPLLRAAGH